MTPNVGKMDRILRAVVGVALLAAALLLEGSFRWVGVIGVVLVVTAAFSFCPAYTLIGLKTTGWGCCKGACSGGDKESAS